MLTVRRVFICIWIGVMWYIHPFLWSALCWWCTAATWSSCVIGFKRFISWGSNRSGSPNHRGTEIYYGWHAGGSALAGVSFVYARQNLVLSMPQKEIYATRRTSSPALEGTEAVFGWDNNESNPLTLIYLGHWGILQAVSVVQNLTFLEHNPS